MRLRFALICGLSLAAFALGGCSSDQVSFVPSPPSRPQLRPSAGELAAQREHQRLLALFGGEYQAPRAKRLLDDLVARLARAAPPPALAYEVTILNSPAPNAFALPNGRLYVTRGLLALANDTAEAGAVLAHEMSHVIARHASERAELQLRSALFSKVVADVLNDPSAGQAAQAQGRVTVASFSRQQELEADKIGVGLLARAKLDPYGAQRFLVSLGRAPILRGQGLSESPRNRNADMLSTHPSTPERVAQAQAAARQISAPGLGEQDRASWLAALEGISFGDDPAAGLVQGRRYVNTSLGVTFETPSSLPIESGRDAVIGATADGAVAFRFDVVTLETGQSLTSYMNSRWIEGVTLSDVQSTTIASNPAVTASGKGSDWSFRMAAVQARSLTYRFIVAGNGEAAELERSFRSIIDSFQPVTTTNARNVAPRRLRIVRASASDTITSLAAQMNVDSQSVLQFQVLNGLDRSAGIVAGESYKVIGN
ncbi:MAG: M48 family metalloprotease [Bosea sp. (in: a-proteobacteria)]